jgi:hypothetical protein
MPIYHFHSSDGSRDVDAEGTELPNDAAARLAAVRYAGEMLKDEPARLWSAGQWRVEVTDDRNALLFTVITIAVDTPTPDSVPAA